MRVLGLDYGTKTVGVALSDALMMTAQGLETIERKSAGKLRRTLARIEEIIREYDEQGEQHEVGLIVLGYPLNMDDSEGERCRATIEFQEALERRTGLPVVLWDERLTTVEADGILSEGGVRKKDRKTYIDKVAAAIILQNYLDAQAEKTAETTAE
jgi:putative Holliday junction resolvase